MNITDVRWSLDHHGKPVLELRMDGHPAHIRSGQKTALADRGIVSGVVFLASERTAQVPQEFIHGDYAPTYTGLDLVGCTDDPRVFALFQEMCAAIRNDTWREGARSVAG
jgi:hypothetical protein